jgi:AraC-like DNA-binding protein
MTARAIARCTQDDGPRFHGGLGGDVLRRILAHVEANLGEHISLDQLASLAGLSRFHFARQFRISTGQSPMGYVRRARIERAKAILRARHITIAQVAVSLGFADQSHFTRTFARLIGVSPRSFAAGRTEPVVAHQRPWSVAQHRWAKTPTQAAARPSRFRHHPLPGLPR